MLCFFPLSARAAPLLGGRALNVINPGCIVMYTHNSARGLNSCPRMHSPCCALNVRPNSCSCQLGNTSCQDPTWSVSAAATTAAPSLTGLGLLTVRPLCTAVAPCATCQGETSGQLRCDQVAMATRAEPVSNMCTVCVGVTMSAAGHATCTLSMQHHA